MPAWSRILTLPSQAKALTDDDGTRYIEGCVSSGQVDRQNEVVHQDSLLRAYQRANGLPYLRDHDPGRAIGRVTEWGMDGSQVATRAQIVPPAGAGGKTSRARADADDLIDLLDIGTPVSQSIGFNPVDINDWAKSGAEVEGIWWWGGSEGDLDIELLETSAVMIGANREADLHMAKGLGLELAQPWADEDEDAALTKEQREEARFIDDLTAAAGRLEAARNIIRHWEKHGRTLSPEALDAVLNPMGYLPEIVRAGRVLSARNREAVLAALDALTEVVRRDDESRSRSEPDEKALECLDHTVMRSILDAPMRRK